MSVGSASKSDAPWIDKSLLSSSHRGTRALLWVVSLPLGIIVSAVCAGMRMPDAPPALILGLGVAIWPIFGVLFDRLIVLQAEAFDAVFSGDREQQQQILARRFSTWMASVDVHGTAALELAIGDVVRARQRLGTVPKARFGPALWMARLSNAHLLVMDPNPAERAKTLATLLAIQPTRKLGRRYRAYLLAQAALHEPVAFVEVDGVRSRDVTTVRGHDDLCRQAALEIRAYGDPIAVHFARFIEAARQLDGVAGELPADLRVSAMLARNFGVPPIADEIDARATAAERAEAGKGPYRA